MQTKTGFQCILLLFFSIVTYIAQAQERQITLQGTVENTQGNPVELANISVAGTNKGTSTSADGTYSLSLEADSSLEISISCTGYNTRVIPLKKIADFQNATGEKVQFNPVLEMRVEWLDKVNIRDQSNRKDNLVRINPKVIENLPTASGGGVESLLKTYAGVTSTNELSSQYSVRGGNFDENLVYVNDIKIYRPQLIRAGQQEGLSFVNKDMVSSVVFSTGGFSAKYGDKMSSVLDVKYRKPTSYAGGVSMSLLGASAYLEGASDNEKFTHISGFRYKTSEYILGSLETEGDYQPSFMDFQTFLTYDVTPWLELNFLGNVSENKFKFVPKERSTSFGTINKALNLYVDFSGQEEDRFNAMTTALSARIRPSNKLSMKLIASLQTGMERENYDIKGRYSLNLLDRRLGESLGDSLMNLGIGSYLDHARNTLYRQVQSYKYIGTYTEEQQSLRWGLSLRDERITDEINEWRLLDSAGYSIPYDDETIALSEYTESDNRLNTRRLKFYSEYSRNLYLKESVLSFRAGFRASYWNYNKQFLFSPRMSLSFHPAWQRDILFRFSSGIYHQPPFYKELRTHGGELVSDIRAQQSVHYVLSADYNFYAWGRPFKFVAEAYYKSMPRLIPYEIDNVRIRYFPELEARGYTRGFDLKINGEFVEGVDSWASLSYMRSQENIKGDGHGWIPRPLDQRINAGLFFQDYLPNNESYKLHLTLLYGAPLPFGPPNAPRHEATLRMPSYKRVDLGMSKVLVEKGDESSAFDRFFKSLWLKGEVYNLLDIRNTISYNWITVVPNTSNPSPDAYAKYAVPNRLTGRRFNIKLIAKF